MLTIFRFCILLLLTALTVWPQVCYASEEIYPVTNALPQERVYLHLDNTSYRQGDNIWFKAYIVNFEGKAVSNTLYVELLNPGGQIIERKTYRIEDGQAHGDIAVRYLPFYTGLYEIRAYTKHMLNFGEQNYFSRAIPIFEKPQKDNDQINTNLKLYNNPKFTNLRKGTKKSHKLNLKFYPEGGYSVKGIPSRVAFEATDAYGHPLAVAGTIIEGDSIKLANLEVSHQGKGMFTYTPSLLEAHALVEYKGKEYKFKLPKALDSGYALSVDNLSDNNHVNMTVMRAGNEAKDTIGVVLVSQGVVRDYVFWASTFEKPLNISFDKNLCLPGVSEIVLVNKDNVKIANRYIFKSSDDTFTITHAFDKSEYQPYDSIGLSLALKQKDGTPVTAPFSLSVRDTKDEISWDRNILTDLLLMSDIKGYVADPMYYFESGDETHRLHLDLLLMVQGWEKYPWNQIKDLSADKLHYMPEINGIAVNGIVSSYNLKKPKEGVDVSVLLLKREKDENGKRQFLENKLTTDSVGRFDFEADVDGDWQMVLAASKNKKKQNVTISLDNQFSPAPRQYAPYEYKFEKYVPSEVSANAEATDNVDIYSEEYLTDTVAFSEDVIKLKEIEVKAKRSVKAQDIDWTRKHSVEHYDVKGSTDKLYDSGIFYCDDVNTFLCKVNKNFFTMFDRDMSFLFYKHKLPLVVIDYETTYLPDEFNYKILPVEWIKSVYIVEDRSIISLYCDPRINPDRYGCAVLLETFPESERPVAAGEGVRKTIFHGYSTPSEFYSPDYSSYTPDGSDHRRTLYWNPMLKPDENGNVAIRFFNNDNITRPTADAQTITPSGIIGTSK